MVQPCRCLVPALVLVFGAFASAADAQSFNELKPIVVVEPAPGREVVGSLPDDWCDGVTPDHVDANTAAGRLSRSIRHMKQSGLEDHSLGGDVATVCAHQDNPEFKKQAQYLVQLFVNGSGRSVQGAIESLVARSNFERWRAEKTNGCDAIREPEEASERDVNITRGRRAAVGCGSGPTYLGEWRWYVDRKANPDNELDRLYYVKSCFRDELPPEQYTADDWARIGLCGNDVRALDRAKIDRATASMPKPLQVIARETHAKARAMLADLERSAKPKVESDPDYKRLLYDAPQAAWKKWEADYQKYKKEVDATFKFEDQLFGPSVKAYQDCVAALEPGVQQYVKASKIKSQADFVGAMSEPIGFVLLTALGSCHAVTEMSFVGEVLLDTIEKSRSWRGPRTAVSFAMLDAVNDIRADRTRFPVTPKYLVYEYDNKSQLRSMAYSEERTKITSRNKFNDESRGVVKAVTKHAKAKDVLVATFKTESWMEPTVSCQKTGRIYKVTNSGEVIYEQKCRSTGKTKETFTPRPTYFYKPAATGVKPNAFVRMRVPAGSDSGPKDQGRNGWPIEVYTNKGKTKLVNIYGFKP